MKNIAIVGIQGVPAQYGGFETLVENIIGENASQEVNYTVFCSSKDYPVKQKYYQGARLKYIPFFCANGIQSIPYDSLSLMYCIKGYDAVLMLGVSGCTFLPIFKLFSRTKIIVNIDGLEHRRAKWGGFAKWFLKTSEKFAIFFADTVIADNVCIQKYVQRTYHKHAQLITYGGDHVLRNVSEEKQQDILKQFNIKKQEYAVTICRIEPENNCHITLEAFSKCNQTLVFVGNWGKNKYSQELKMKYSQYPNIHLIDSIYDLDFLYTIRKNCRLYIHGHSAGGTNPSLVEAMFFGCPILTYDVKYNRETTNNKAYYYSNSDQLVSLLENPNLDASDMLQFAQQNYRWKIIAQQYEALYPDRKTK
ncbi:MAG: DUF1972 domain-containing protein [Bacteroidaceae bacterium]|nr:DUF1972 domain-containing protein [Bacteroidaceae bacterium]